MKAFIILAVLVVAGCASVPPLEKDERFKVSCRRGEKPDECIVRVQALFAPPPPIGPYMHGQVQIVAGKVELEIKGWGRPDAPGQEERVLEAKVGVRPGEPFVFALLDRGHRDEYTITVPATGDPVVEPAAGEFSERG